jgi:hypothetical protein
VQGPDDSKGWALLHWRDSNRHDAWYHQPSEQQQIVFPRCLDLYHTLPDSGKRQYESKT